MLHSKPGYLPAGKTGDGHPFPVDPDSHVHPGHEIPETMVTETAPVFMVNPDPFAHCNLPCKGDVPVAEIRMIPEYPLCLGKQNCYPFPRQRFCSRGSSSLLHDRQVPYYRFPGYKKGRFNSSKFIRI